MIFYYSNVGNPVVQVWQHGPAVGFFGLAAAFFLSCMLNMNENKLTDDESIQEVEGIDYGRGMAYSYYYGYLRFVLPSDGINNPGIRSKIEMYEASENVTIPVKKLFILIPESGYIPPDLSEASNYRLEGAKSLQSEIRDRAGTKRRDYKNTVYKIHPNNYEPGHRPVYIVVEGATPMLTLYEILQHNHEQTATYRRNKKQIVASFYETLAKLVSDPSCRNVVELVYYQDDDDTGNRINVAEMLLDRIRQQALQSF
ncbi:hypothetical protein HCN44_008689 [Aphidius gifuensis]|uniref:STING ligand-binding domain-containing protein n=2 Tax=Aphidius gifuensis TaxID=684658 RepID=A0A834XMW7_APHGI|nr:hypothetical protein HCN44_008689 [Aphidius gifuensis]